ncbi:polysaccharide biosynthesis protein [Ktedonobacter racemifer DSM 44963]|uniref:Polysaccharide biosynthesis protein n=1 Tax=Ktedonobacter racemifer DSM 44963 TaxID=485913 RepID=D6U599_KTERA|nr:polysaccharide biosynthesis protein [Ktedonobacter racemifer DSM 44963]
MITSLFGWIKRNSTLLFNTGSLIGTMVVTSGLGFAYWWVAARLFKPQAVGLASAATSAMMLLSAFCMFGLTTLIITELPRNKGKEGSLISTALLIVGGISLIAGAIFAMLAPLLSRELNPLGANGTNIAAFAISICITSITVLVDQAVIGLLKGGLQFWRNAIFSAAKLVALYLLGTWFSDTIGMSIYATWTLGNIISLIPLFILALWKMRKRLHSILPSRTLLRNLGASAIQHHILNLILSAPVQVLPLMVTILLSASMNAWFYVASMMANFVFSISLSLTTVLHATNAAQANTLSQKTKLTVLLASLIGLIACIIVAVAAEPVLRFFGPSYATQAAWPLRLLCIGAFPLIIKDHFIAIRRIKDEITSAMLPIILGSVMELVLAAIGAKLGGLSGFCLAWVIALGVEALFMSRLVIRTMLGVDPDANTISSIADTDTMIMQAIRPGTFIDDWGTVIETPTQRLNVVMSLSSSTDFIKSLVLTDAPTVQLQRISSDEQPTVKLKRIKTASRSSGIPARNIPKTPKLERNIDTSIADAPTLQMRGVSLHGEETVATPQNDPVVQARHDSWSKIGNATSPNTPPTIESYPGPPQKEQTSREKILGP